MESRCLTPVSWRDIPPHLANEFLGLVCCSEGVKAFLEKLVAACAPALRQRWR